jgi:UDP-glucose 4-epimerase
MIKNKNILVTGGAGFIGSNLVKELIKNENSVTVLDDFSTGYRVNLDIFPSVNIIEGDIRNKLTMEYAMNGIDIIFHLAASVGNKRSIENPIYDSDVNVLGTIQVLEAARKAKVQKIVVTSSAAIYGELKFLPITESHPAEPDSPYGCSKLAEEKLALSYAKMYNMNIVCLRYFNVYGPNQRYDAYGSAIPIFVTNMIKNMPIFVYGDGDQTRDFVNVYDVVQANIKAASTDNIHGAFNIGSGKSVTVNEIIKIILKNNKAEVIHKPERIGEIRHSMADISSAHANFDYTPSVKLEEGINDYIEWIKNV